MSKESLLKIKVLLKKVKQRGFFEIVFSSAIVKVLMFLSAMFLPRFLPVDDYGRLTYAETILNYFMIFSGLGLTAATMKYCAIAKEISERKKILVTTSIIGVLFNLVLATVGFVSLKFICFKIDGTEQLLKFMLAIPIASFIFQNIQLYLRADFENKKYAIITLIYTLCFVGFQIGAAIIYGVEGVIFARYFAYGICIIILLIFIRDLFLVRINNTKVIGIKEMVEFSLGVLVANFFSTAMLNNETLLVGNYFSQPVLLANYKVASYALQICNFFSESLVIFLTPYFAKYSNNRKWLWKKTRSVLLLNGIMMSVIILGLFIWAKYVVLMFWGSKYMSAVPIMRVLLIAALFQTVIRAIPGNMLPYIGGLAYNVKINIITCCFHFLFTCIVFKYFGEKFIGVGIVAAYFVSGVYGFIHARRLCKAV